MDTKLGSDGTGRLVKSFDAANVEAKDWEAFLKKATALDVAK